MAEVKDSQVSILISLTLESNFQCIRHFKAGPNDDL